MDNVIEIISQAMSDYIFVLYVQTQNGLTKFLIKDSEMNYMTNLKEL